MGVTAASYCHSWWRVMMVWYFVIETPTRLCPKSFFLFLFWICFYWHNCYLQSVIVELSLQFHSYWYRTRHKPIGIRSSEVHSWECDPSNVCQKCIFCKLQLTFVTVKGVIQPSYFAWSHALGSNFHSQLDPSYSKENFLLSRSDAARVKIIYFSSHCTKCDASLQKLVIRHLRRALLHRRPPRAVAYDVTTWCMLWNLPLYHHECYNLQTATCMKLPTQPSTSVSRHPHVHPCICYLVECDNLKFPADPTLSPWIEK